MMKMHSFRFHAFLTFGLLLAATLTRAQSVADPSTLPAMSPGTPAGSYVLSGFDTVDLYSGKVNFVIPIRTVGGRAQAGYDIVFSLQTNWGVELIDVGETFGYYPTGAGGLSSTPYAAGNMFVRSASSPQDQSVCPNGLIIVSSGYTLTRLTFTTPDGTQTEFVDQSTGGKPFGPYSGSCTGPNTGFSRGTTFVATDGSGMTFIANSAIADVLQGGPYSFGVLGGGTLFFADGRRYDIDTLGNVTAIHDSNGNTVTLSIPAATLTATDELGRVANVTYHNLNQNVVQDLISFPGEAGTAANLRTVTVNYAAMDTVLASGQAIQDLSCLFPNLNGSGTYDQVVVSSIVLPNGSQYSFKYNSYGEVASVALPTGGLYEYDYPTIGPPPQGGGCPTTLSNGPNFGNNEFEIYRRLTERRVYPDGITLEQRTTYAPTYASPNTGQMTVLVQHYDPTTNAVTGQDNHYFYGDPSVMFSDPSMDPTDPSNLHPDTPPPNDPTHYTPWLEAKEFQTDFLDKSGNLLRRTLETWQQHSCSSPFSTDVACWWPGENQADLTAPMHYGAITEVDATLADVTPNQTSRVTNVYDGYNNKAAVSEYDYSGSLIRRTQTTFVTDGYDSAGNGPSLRRLPLEQTVFDGSGTQVADTLFYYDESSLTTRSAVSGYIAPSFSMRGNLTTVSRWLNSSSSYINIRRAYDVLGNVVKSTDALSYSTQYTYADQPSPASATPLNGQSSFAFPTTITNPAGHVTTLSYDYFLGKPVQLTDPNNTLTTFDYTDPLDRPKTIVRASGQSAASQTVYSYCDQGCNTVTTLSDQKSLGDGLLQQVLLYDGLGRLKESRLFESATSYISTQRSYDWMGRPYSVTNPFRPASEVAVYTTYGYDALNRRLSVTYPDSSVENTSFSGNMTSDTDPCGISHQKSSDAAGRLVQVVEGRSGSTTSACVNDTTQSSSLTTTYTYDALDRLKQVAQSSQERTFTYDSLGRLTQAKNPESGTINYTSYDANGNLLAKTDSRSVTTTMGYDNLNRVLSKSYSDNCTPSVSYVYDTIFKGALSSVTAAGASGATGPCPSPSFASSTTFDQYDPLGRVLHSTQTTSGQAPFLFSYAYNLAGALISETYPSGRTILTCYDGANRPDGVSLAANCPSGSYASGILYASHGAMNQMTLGNGIVEGTLFNSRLQPTQIQAGALTLGYSFPSGTNNGDIGQQTITWSELQPIKQYYQYDQFNHLYLASENSANPTASTCAAQGTVSWCEHYGYDTFANRSIAETTLGSSPLTPASFNTATNQNSGTGWAYDGVGNIISDPLSTAYQFDAESRQISAGSSTYVYDGDGRRVLRTVSGLQAVYAYDVFGNLAAEYGSTNELVGTVYLTADHLGSTRLITSANNTLVNGSSPGAAGTPIECRDYLPFGEQILVTRTSPRAGLSCFASEVGVRQQFTSKERDAETGLDFFDARYFSSPQGRFTSTDPVIVGPHKVTNPQNWNLYAYARNSPLRFTDPTGEIIEEDIDDKYQKRYEAWKAEFLKSDAGQALWNKYQDDANFTLTIKVGANAGGEQGAETTGYHWNGSGQLDAATILLGAKLNSGYPSGDNYPVTSSLRPDSGGAELSGNTIAATKLAHEFGHVEFTAGTPQNVFGLQNFLFPVWNSVFRATGQTSQPDIERLMGGTPVQINMMRERGAEGAGAVPYLRDRFPGRPGESMPKRIQQAIQNFEKGK